MAVLTADFEAGTNGNTISTGDAGSATAWDDVQIPSPAALTYDSTPALGALSAEVVPSTATTGIHMEWSTALGTVTDHYGRAYVNVAVVATQKSVGRIIMTRSGAQNGAQIVGLPDGTIVILDGLNNVVDTSVVTITGGSWYRLEWHFVHSTSAGSIDVRIFLDPTATTPDETLSASSINTRVNATLIRFGLSGGNPSGASTIWLDNIVANATDWPGPVGAYIPRYSAHDFGSVTI